MRKRPSARILLVDEEGRVLLFRFVFKSGALAGNDFWATPGGALETGESYDEGGRRELREETSLEVETLGEPVAEQEFIMVMSNGEQVLAQERFFVVRMGRQAISRELWTPLEKEVMTEHRWWSLAEITASKDVIYPENLIALITGHC
jgi:ADP-ribose pyrophosphatase YjhB (NUDIX family)